MLEVIIDGQVQDRAAVLAWERRRMAIVRRKLGLSPSPGPIEQQREELADRKLALGHARVRALIRRGLWLAGKVSRLSVAMSGNARRFSVCEIKVATGSASHFVRWFDDLTALNREREMIVACPDHYIIARDAVGRQLVVETTGGSPTPVEFWVDYADVSSLQTFPDTSYPYQVAGTARLSDGLVIGGVRHQFRQEGAGFRALLTVEFPGRMPRRMIAVHRWHLAAEFSN